MSTLISHGGNSRPSCRASLGVPSRGGIGEYATQEGLPEICVIFHGGEPLLAGSDCLVETTQWIRAAVPLSTTISFSLQTNGTLLDETRLTALVEANIGISLSIDGGKSANDLHRLDHKGKSSFDTTLRALELLEANPSIYSGLISVVDPRISPEELFGFFGPRKPPRWDFLLPDAHHERLPPGRQLNPRVYERWLIHAFDIWFDEYSDVPVRTFDAILAACAGLPSETDAFGFGAPTMLTIETDGSYHDLDVLKITETGATSLDLHLETHTIAEASYSPKLASHRELLRREGLAEVCQGCAEVNICGGGSVPHRYSSSGLRNPTVYCGEMLSLIGHARKRMEDVLSREAGSAPNTASLVTAELDLEAWERPESSGPWLASFLKTWAGDVAPEWNETLAVLAQRFPEYEADVKTLRRCEADRVAHLTLEPAVRLWTTVMASSFKGRELKSMRGATVAPDPSYVRVLAKQIALETEVIYPRIHRSDQWLRLPFDRDLVFEEEQVGVCWRTYRERGIGRHPRMAARTLFGD